ncbi:hypothetical protein GCM10017774_83700 [Lentzea cavernae]|uniref:Uncharacterized protein n=1 Tax=Lentzea cavernae TaxID=2020703 RepID=A0ABQ3MVT1_9PSEU|nr:hypothetical protein GCM10017774_83700 [Lentzea cavernae]
MPERHDGPDVDGVDRGEHVLTGLRPATAAAHPPVLDVPHGESFGDEHVGKRPSEFQAVPLVPKTTVNDDNTTLSNTLGKVKLAELTGMVTVSNSLHTQKVRENKPNELVRPCEYVETQGFPARGYPCASVPCRRLTARNTAQHAENNEEEPPKPKGAPRGPKPGGRFAARRRRRTEGGGVRRVLWSEGRIVYSVSG